MPGSSAEALLIALLSPSYWPLYLCVAKHLKRDERWAFFKERESWQEPSWWICIPPAAGLNGVEHPHLFAFSPPTHIKLFFFFLPQPGLMRFPYLIKLLQRLIDGGVKIFKQAFICKHSKTYWGLIPCKCLLGKGETSSLPGPYAPKNILHVLYLLNKQDLTCGHQDLNLLIDRSYFLGKEHASYFLLFSIFVPGWDLSLFSPWRISSILSSTSWQEIKQQFL